MVVGVFPSWYVMVISLMLVPTFVVAFCFEVISLIIGMVRGVSLYQEIWCKKCLITEKVLFVIGYIVAIFCNFATLQCELVIGTNGTKCFVEEALT